MEISLLFWHYCGRRSGLMVRALDSRANGPDSSPGRGHCVVFLGKTLYSALIVPLSTQVYKWVLVNCWENLTNCRGVACDGLASRPGEVEILLVAPCYRNRDKLWQLWASLGSKASLLVLLLSLLSVFLQVHPKRYFDN